MALKMEHVTVPPSNPDTDCVLDLTCSDVQPSPVKSEVMSTPARPMEEQKKRDLRKCRKRMRMDEDEESEAKRLLANTQERVRMQKMNKALEELKNVLPSHLHTFQKRMSKIRTLRLAMNYIAWLSDLIQKDNARREEAYRQSLQYMHQQGYIPQFSPDGALMSSIYPYAQDNMQMMPTCVTPAFTPPYHAYASSFQGPANISTVETPVNNPSRQRPRQLKFYSNPTQEPRSGVETVIAGSVQNPVKTETRVYSEKDNFRDLNVEPGEIVTPRISKFQKYQKAETFISPFMASRNQNELDLSFLSTGSDSNRDEIEGGARGKTLADIIDGSSSDDDVVRDDSLGIQM